jgi:hypothetical protein
MKITKQKKVLVKELVAVRCDNCEKDVAVQSDEHRMLGYAGGTLKLRAGFISKHDTLDDDCCVDLCDECIDEVKSVFKKAFSKSC